MKTILTCIAIGLTLFSVTAVAQSAKPLDEQFRERFEVAKARKAAVREAELIRQVQDSDAKENARLHSIINALKPQVENALQSQQNSIKIFDKHDSANYRYFMSGFESGLICTNSIVFDNSYSANGDAKADCLDPQGNEKVIRFLFKTADGVVTLIPSR